MEDLPEAIANLSLASGDCHLRNLPMQNKMWTPNKGGASRGTSKLDIPAQRRDKRLLQYSWKNIPSADMNVLPREVTTVFLGLSRRGEGGVGRGRGGRREGSVKLW